eukprot:gene6841-7948_t
MGSWAQELALRRVATQRKTGCGDHELDPDVLTRLPTRRASEINKLLPHRWAPV